MDFKYIAMDHEALLALATRHVSEGMTRVQRQRELLERLKRDGHSTQQAERFLATLELLIGDMIKHHEELRAAIPQQQLNDTKIKKPSN